MLSFLCFIYLNGFQKSKTRTNIPLPHDICSFLLGILSLFDKMNYNYVNYQVRSFEVWADILMSIEGIGRMPPSLFRLAKSPVQIGLKVKMVY